MTILLESPVESSTICLVETPSSRARNIITPFACAIIGSVNGSHSEIMSETFTFTPSLKFNLQPKECMIVEDAPKGLEAARQTGANVYEVSGYNEVTLENILTKINYFGIM